MGKWYRKQRRCVAAATGFFVARSLAGQPLNYVPGNDNGWNLTQLDWNAGGQNLPWTNGDQALFGPVYPFVQIPVQDSVSASNMSFNQTGQVTLYSQSVNGSNPTLTLTGVNPTLSLAQAQANISVPINGSAGVIIQDNASGDSAKFSGANNYTGLTNVASGQLTLASPTALGSSSLNIAPSGTVDLASNCSVSGSTVNNSGQFYVEPYAVLSFASPVTFTQTAGVLQSHGTVVLNGGSFNDSGGQVTGTIALDGTTSLYLGSGAHSGTFSFNGSSALQTIASPGTATTVPSGVTVQQQTGTSAAGLTVSGNLQNNGTISLTASNYQASLMMSGTTLNNAGTLNLNSTGLGYVTLNATALNNSAGATAFFNAPLDLTTNIAIQNSGTFIYGGSASFYSLRGASFNQIGGSLLLNQNLPWNGSFVYIGGSITGSAVEMLGGSNLTLGVNVSSGTFLFDSEQYSQNLYLAAPNYSVPAGVTLSLQTGLLSAVTGSTALTSATNLANYGTILLAPPGSGTAALNFTFNGAVLSNNSILTTSGDSSKGASDTLNVSILNNSAGATVTIGGATSFTGTTINNSGTFNIATGQTLTMTQGVATFNQTAGTLAVNGTLSINNGYFRYFGGTIAGNPISINVGSGGLTLGPGAGSGSFVLTSPGTQSVSFSGSTDVIPAGLSIAVQPLSGSIFSPFTANLTNNGSLIFSSAVGGGIQITGGTATITNNGTFAVACSQASVFNVSAQAFNNAAGATVTFSSPTTFINMTTFNNAGVMNIGPGVTVTMTSNVTFNQSAGTLNNSGTLSLTQPEFIFAGGSILGNPIQLAGTNLVLGTNAGSGSFTLVSGGATQIQPLSGTLTIPKSVTYTIQPNANGSESGATAILYGNAINNGTISLIGTQGGAAILQTSGLTNNGVIRLSGGTQATSQSEISGNLINAASGTVEVDTGAYVGSYVTNYGTFNISSGTNVNGVYFTQYSGTLSCLGSVSSSATLNWTGGTIIIGGAVPAFGGAPEIPSGGTLILQPSVTNPTKPIIADGMATAILQANVNSATGILTRYLTGIGIELGGQVDIQAANIQSNRQFIFTDSLQIAVGDRGRLDLANNDMDVYQGNLQTISSYLAIGYNNGAWNGSGVASSVAAADSSHLTALGVLQNNASLYGINGSLGTFDGFYPRAGDILVKFTWYGDANLDGKVDGSDYSLIDSAFATVSTSPVTGWSNGDFNYDGVVNGSDYALIDNAFNSQGAVISTRIASQISNTAVPEPASPGLVGLTAVGLLGRRRR